jgi:hypothetical protein
MRPFPHLAFPVPDTSLLAAALASFSVLLSGCTTTTISLQEGTREYVADDYETVLKLWTREKELLSVREFDNVLQATATFESWDFRWAYVIRYAEDYRLTVDQRRSLLEAALAETREHHQFYVAIQAKRVRWSNLKSDPAAWIVRLIDDAGSETAPSTIEEIDRPGAIELTYFPYTTPWRKAFRIRFPTVRSDGRPTISANAQWFGLRFAGAQGNDELIWTLDES